MDKDPNRPVEIRDLNKTQLILLALLLSFVTSIATGIVTVTLMQQAPTGVTQTINRVVQQTIEKVVPDYAPGKTQTVVVKEDDLVIDAVSKTQANIGDLYSKADSAFIGSAYSIGKGVFITSAGNVQADGAYVIKKDKLVLDVKSITASSELGIAVLSAADALGNEKNLPNGEIAKDGSVKPGQTLVVADADSVQKGTVQSVGQETVKDSAGAAVMTWNTINLDIPMHQIPLGPVVNLDGALVGFVSENIKGAEIIGMDAVTTFIQASSKPVTASPAPPAAL